MFVWRGRGEEQQEPVSLVLLVELVLLVGGDVQIVPFDRLRASSLFDRFACSIGCASRWGLVEWLIGSIGRLGEGVGIVPFDTPAVYSS